MALMLLCIVVNLLGTDVMVQRCISSQSWDRKQHLVLNMWQVAFDNVLIESRVVDSDVNGFFDGSGHTMSLPSYDFEVLH